MDNVQQIAGMAIPLWVVVAFVAAGLVFAFGAAKLIGTLAFRRMHGRFLTAYRRAQMTGRVADYDEAVGIARALQGAASGKARRSMVLNDLGAALAARSELDDDRERLAEAAGVFESAVALINPVKAPREWALAQHNLGAIQAQLAELDGNAEHLSLAIETLRGALDALDPDKHAEARANVELDLSNALAAMGEYTADPAPLEEAAALLEARLGTAKGAENPVTRAKLQVSLGSVLRVLGAREVGSDRLDAAIAALRDALKALAAPPGAGNEPAPHDIAQAASAGAGPFDRLTARLELAEALRHKGLREADSTETLEEAIATYEAVLEDTQTNDVPLLQARAQSGRGAALWRLADRVGMDELYEQAETACRAAFETVTPDESAVEWGLAQFHLGEALLAIAMRPEARGGFDAAEASLDAASDEVTRDRMPVAWAAIQAARARLALARYDQTGNAAQLDLAESAAESAREVVAAAGASYLVELADKVIADVIERRMPQPQETGAAPGGVDATDSAPDIAAEPAGAEEPAEAEPAVPPWLMPTRPAAPQTARDGGRAAGDEAGQPAPDALAQPSWLTSDAPAEPPRRAEAPAPVSHWLFGDEPDTEAAPSSELDRPPAPEPVGEDWFFSQRPAPVRPPAARSGLSAFEPDEPGIAAPSSSPPDTAKRADGAPPAGDTPPWLRAGPENDSAWSPDEARDAASTPPAETEQQAPPDSAPPDLDMPPWMKALSEKETTPPPDGDAAAPDKTPPKDAGGQADISTLPGYRPVGSGPTPRQWPGAVPAPGGPAQEAAPEEDPQESRPPKRPEE
jgi:tetratricopeptide (TPR) repeat protein